VQFKCGEEKRDTLHSPLTDIQLHTRAIHLSTHHEVTIILDDKDSSSNMPSEQSELIVSNTKAQSPNIPAKSCPGYQLMFPPSQQAHTSYPFGLHSLLSLPWDYSAQHEGFFLVSHSCTGVVRTSQRCKPCDGLKKNEYLKKIVTRYTYGTHKNSLLVFHGISGLIDVVHRKTSANDVLRLHHLNDVKKLLGREGVIDVHKQMLLALSSQRVPCIDQLTKFCTSGSGMGPESIQCLK
jgi:hypothetical protein